MRFHPKISALLFAFLIGAMPTAWAQTSGFVAPASATYVAASGDAGKILSSENVPGGAITVTLPSPGAVAVGWLMGFSEANAKGIIINTPLSVYIDAGQKQMTSFTVPSNANYEYAAIINDGTNFRLLTATSFTSFYNGLLGSAGGHQWFYLYATGYGASLADNGRTLNSALAGGAVTLTLPSSPLLPNGWAIDLFAAGGNSITVQPNAVSGGTLTNPQGTSVTTYVLPALPTNGFAKVSFDGAAFHVSLSETPGIACTGTSDDNAVLLASDAAGNGTEIKSACLIGSNTTLTKAVHINQGGSFSVNSGKTLTLNGSFRADTTAPFSGSGTVVIAGAAGSAASAAPFIYYKNTTDTYSANSGLAGLVIAVHGNQNGIYGSVVNDLPPNTADFPVGVSGIGQVMPGSAGNLAFGLYGEANLRDNGIASNEFDANNWKGQPDVSFPPNQVLGTTTNVVVPGFFGCGGAFACSMAIAIGRNGAAPQQSNVGLYIWPDSVASYGIYTDAQSGVGPTYGGWFKTKSTGINMTLQTAGTAAPNNTVFQVIDNSLNPHASISQGGAYTVFSEASPPTPVTGSFVLYMDSADNKLKAKAQSGTVTTLAIQ